MDGIRFDGLATGLDTSSLVNALIGQERRPLTLVLQRQSLTETRQALFRQLNTHLDALADAAKALDNQNDSLTGPTLDEELIEYKATSSDDGFVRATVTGDASAGSPTVRVDALAEVGRRTSLGFATSTDVIAAAGETMSIDFGGVDPIDITIGAGGASLEQLRDLINDHTDNDDAVRADLIFDGAGHRLILSGTQTGAANDLTVTTDIAGPGGTGPFLDAAQTVNASDAQIQVLGLTITRPENTITDVIPGVSLDLVAAHDPASPLDTETISVARDDRAIGDKLQDFVDAYNTIRDFTTAQTDYDELRSTAGPLSGDATLRAIDRQLRTTVGSAFTFTDNPFTSLGQVGISFDRDGRLELDTDVMTEALDQDVDAVREFFSGDGTTDGVAAALARQIEPITKSSTGTLAIRDDGFDDRIKIFDQTIDRMERRLEQREELLIRQFSRLESLVSSLQAQGGFLASAFAANSNRGS